MTENQDLCSEIVYNDGSANDEILKLRGYVNTPEFQWFSWLEYRNPTTNVYCNGNDFCVFLED